jgi:hypothetical protein
MRFVHEDQSKPGKLFQVGKRALDGSEGNPIPVGGELAFGQMVGRNPFRQLKPECTVKLIDKGPCVCEDKNTPMLDAIITKKVGDDLGHHNRLAKACGENDLGATRVKKRPPEPLGDILLVCPQFSSGWRIFRRVRHHPHENAGVRDLDAKSGALITLLFSEKRLAWRARSGDHHAMRPVILGGFDNLADGVLWRGSRSGMLALKHPKFASLYSEYVGSPVAGASYKPHVIEAIRQQETREVALEGLPRPE